MVLVRSAVSALFVCSSLVACGGTSGHDDSASTGATAGNAGVLSAGGGGNSNAGGSSSGGRGGVNSAGGTNSAGGASGGRGGNASSSGASSGGTGSGGSGAVVEYTGPGTVTDIWSGVCVATFTADYMAKDVFQKSLFTARTGEKYLIERINDVVATLIYLTPNGPVGFDVNATFPFTSNCAPSPQDSYFAVFADVSIFAEPELVTKLCDLKAGAKVARDLAKNAGYTVETFGATSSVYEVFLNAFSAQCGNADNGYLGVSPINVLGSQRILVPFEVIAADK